MARRSQLRAHSLWQRAHPRRWFSRLRRRCSTLAEVRILRFAIRQKLPIDLWQRPAGSPRLCSPTHYGRYAVYKKAIACPGTTLNKSCLLARCSDFGTGSLARRRLHGDNPNQTEDKGTDDGSSDLILVHLLSLDVTELVPFHAGSAPRLVVSLANTRRPSPVIPNRATSVTFSSVTIRSRVAQTRARGGSRETTSENSSGIESFASIEPRARI